MAFKFLIKIFLIILFLFLIFLFFSNSNNYNVNGLNLSVSENISLNISVVVLDSNKEFMTIIDENEHFYIQQRGLAQGTIYGFRVINEKGEVLKPVYETYIARDNEWVEANNYYLQIRPGNQTIEVLIIENGNGIIVARNNILILNFESILAEGCGNLINEPIVDADGWSREGKIGRCASNIAVNLSKVNLCDKLYPMFNDSGAGYGECIMNYANITGNILACNKLSMPKSVGFCKAKVTNDYTECQKIVCDFSCTIENIEIQKDLCIQWYAIENKNSSLCDIIQSEAYNMKEICYNMTLGN
ncbi:MAG: hypothetical protein PHN56_01805 [Candidatus Nanoarchaeia archaeon]|nr:hypothetical protein [Candidatus Nanoarchaeia archaeon]